MNRTHATNEPFGPVFGLDDAPFLSIRPLDGACFSVERIDYRHQGPAPRTFAIPPADIYLLMLYLGDAYHCDIAADGSASYVRRFGAGSVCVIDLHNGVSFRLHSDLRSIAFGLDHALIEEVSGLPQAPTAAAKLRCRRGDYDAELRNLGTSVLPLLEAQDAVAQATLRHIAIAICAHLLHNHALTTEPQPGSCAPLPALREKDARDFMMRHFASDISVANVAAAVGLSAGHFSKAFKSATGITPHRWLQQYRAVQDRAAR
ncbi:MAG: AraC family transcriptional regulator [Ancalomicrobiaceae bacterium]|nr:AraC family transcriptional regulator [Ancalomicrobiaceae bacterium]